MINFASDNYSGVHPAVLKALTEANEGPAHAYGSDAITEKATKMIQSLFSPESSVFLVWNGTSANVLSLQAMLKPYQAVICSDVAHILVDEAGAPEAHTRSKLIAVASENGKLTVERMRPCFQRMGDVHAVQPKVISMTQTTEYGTVYSLDELKEISKLAREFGAFIHMDGARLSNAAASLGCTLREMTLECGVDIVTFGGTKNGLMGVEAIVILNPELAQGFGHVRKQGLHLSSKMRFLSAQFIAYLENELYLQNAQHANRMARVLEAELKKASSQIEITKPVQANSVFAKMPATMITGLQKSFSFYVWNQNLSEVRLMCSFNTTEAEITAFSQAIQRF